MRKRKKEAGLLDWLLLAAATLLAAIIAYYGAGRWGGEGGVAVSSAPPPRSAPLAAQPLAGAKRADPPGVSESFQAVNSIPPMVLSRSGRPTVKTKAPPAPKTVPDSR